MRTTTALLRVPLLGLLALGLAAGGCAREKSAREKSSVGPNRAGSGKVNAAKTAATRPVRPGGAARVGSGATGPERAARIEPLVADETTTNKLVAGLNAFSVRVYKAYGRPDESVILSPFSMAAALALLGLGGEPGLATRVSASIGLPAGISGHRAFGALIKRLSTGPSADSFGAGSSLVNTPGDVLSIANSTWIKNGYPVYAAYRREVAHYYASVAFGLDVSDPPRARARINAWAAQKTRGMIKEPLPSGFIKPVTRFVLVNAVYLKATWRAPFWLPLTKQEPFFTSATAKVSVAMMHKSCPAELGYGHFPEVEVVHLPYRALGSAKQSVAIEFVALLPKRGREGGVTKLLADITPAKLRRWLGGAGNFQGPSALRDNSPPKRLLVQRRRDLTGDVLAAARKRGKKRPLCVDLALPRFKADTFDGRLVDTLHKAGVKRVFGVPELGLISPAARREPLRASSAVHKAIIRLDEIGTIAAAVTAVGASGGGMPQSTKLDVDVRDLRFDRPFVYVIRAVKSGLVLFIGHVSKP